MVKQLASLVIIKTFLNFCTPYPVHCNNLKDALETFAVKIQLIIIGNINLLEMFTDLSAGLVYRQQLIRFT